MKRRTLRPGRIAAGCGLIHLTLFLARAPLLAQCALCRESLGSGRGPGGGDWALGFSWGVLLLLGVLFSLAGGVVGLIVFAARQAPDPEPEHAPGVESAGAGGGPGREAPS